MWGNMNVDQREFRTIANKIAQLEESDIRNIVQTAIKSDTNFVAEELEIVLGDKVAIWSLEWVNTQPKSVLDKIGKEWDKVIRKHVIIVLNSLANLQDISGTSIAFIARLFGSTARSTNLAKTLAKIIKKIDKYDDSLDASSKSFLLEIALSETGKSAAELIEFSFDVVHESLLQDKLPYQEWRQLQRRLPQLGFWDSWDKAEKLRRGVARWFVANSHSIKGLLIATDDKTSLEHLLQAFLRIINGRNYLEIEYDKIISNKKKNHIDDWKIESLKNVIASYW